MGTIIAKTFMGGPMGGPMGPVGPMGGGRIFHWQKWGGAKTKNNNNNNKTSQEGVAAGAFSPHFLLGAKNDKNDKSDQH